MPSTLQPSVEANVSTSMNVDDEELWQAKGLFEKADSTVVGTDTLNTQSVKHPLPPFTRSFHSSGLAPFFVAYLSISSRVPQFAERLPSAQSQEELCKENIYSNQLREVGKGVGNPGYSRR